VLLDPVIPCCSGSSSAESIQDENVGIHIVSLTPTEREARGYKHLI
jgi:hypothetical protein